MINLFLHFIIVIAVTANSCLLMVTQCISMSKTREDIALLFRTRFLLLSDQNAKASGADQPRLKR